MYRPPFFCLFPRKWPKRLWHNTPLSAPMRNTRSPQQHFRTHHERASVTAEKKKTLVKQVPALPKISCPFVPPDQELFVLIPGCGFQRRKLCIVSSACGLA